LARLDFSVDRSANPVAGISKEAARASPSPWGEGRDEGGRETIQFGNGFRRDGENGHRDGRAPQQCPSRAAKGSLGWTNGAMLN
jgi:hypothetical protein